MGHSTQRNLGIVRTGAAGYDVRIGLDPANSTKS